MARSALIATQSGQHERRRLWSRVERERLGEVVEVGFCRSDFASLTQALQLAALRQGPQERHRAPPVSDLDGLPALDLSQQLTRSLSQLSDAGRHHVLFVAHAKSGKAVATGAS